MRKIEKTTLVLVDCYNYGRATLSLKRSMAQCQFERVLFFTDIDLQIDGVEIIKIPPIKSKDQYSFFLLKELWKHITTDFILVTQHDAYILDGEQFDEKLYEVDYVGALWPEQDELANGNGGYSWRSKRLLDAVGKDQLITSTAPEDVSLCRVYRRYLEQNYGLIWASNEICERFSFELQVPVRKTMGFHGYFHPPFQETIVIHRSAALGDLVQCEPILAHFHQKGYRVVLETLPQFFRLYQQHYFKVNHPEEIDGRLLATAKRYDLDMSYESKPKQLHLKTYFEYCEVPESEMDLRNPSLNLNIEKTPGTKLFKKYCVLHLAIRGQTGRNVQGTIDWPVVVQYLKGKGYDTIQIGGSETDAIPGALQMMTPGEPFLMWVIRESDLMISIDSGPSNIAVAFEIPAIIFFGNVEPSYIYADLSNIEVIQWDNVCDTPKCWHRIEGCEGMECIVDKAKPPCVQFTQQQVITAIDNICSKTV